MLKPLNGAASLGVKKVETRAHLDQCYADVLAEMRDTVVTSGALVKKDPLKAADADEEPIYFLMEEYLDGPEVDIDVVVARGEAAYARVVDNGPTAEPSARPRRSSMSILSTRTIHRSLHGRSTSSRPRRRLTERGTTGRPRRPRSAEFFRLGRPVSTDYLRRAAAAPPRP